MVDVEKGSILPDQMVIIDDGLIQAFGPRAELSAPKGTHVIDGGGLSLMPGLVDAHVHYFDPEIFGRVMLAAGAILDGRWQTWFEGMTITANADETRVQVRKDRFHSCWQV